MDLQILYFCFFDLVVLNSSSIFSTLRAIKNKQAMKVF